MNLKQLNHLVANARKYSPLYKALYRDLPDNIAHLSDLPITDKSTLSGTQLSPLTDQVQGLVLHSSGTTSMQEPYYFSHQDWCSLAQRLGESWVDAGYIRAGDSVANLCKANQVVGSFLLMHDSIRELSIPAQEIPIGCNENISAAYTVEVLIKHKANVILCIVHNLLQICHYIATNNIKLDSLRCILYGGETLSQEKYDYIKNVLPECELSSTGYASSDTGFIGYRDKRCGLNQFCCDEEYSIVEILDAETGVAINEVGKEGDIVVTNLKKELSPTIRYMTGDRGKWMEPVNSDENRIFEITGRKHDKNITLNNVVLKYDAIYDAILKGQYEKHLIHVSIEINENAKNSEIIIEVAFSDAPSHVESLQDYIKDLILNHYLELSNLVKSNKVIVTIKAIPLFDIKAKKISQKIPRIEKNHEHNDKKIQ